MVLYLCTKNSSNITHIFPWSFIQIPFEQALNRNNPVGEWLCWLSSLADLRLLAW